jgi:BirA family biotin operon repressor/biotin-[acetyl-CoA-carboxylase] ligase
LFPYYKIVKNSKQKNNEFIFAKSNNSLSSLSIIKTIGYPFTELDKVDSTNNYAFDRLQANLAAHGAAFFSHTQTAGKGQRGKVWETQPGSNIILSVTLDMSFLSVNKQFLLSMAVALASHDFFSKYAGDETKIKWPNDIYWRDRKAGGILIESLVTSGKPIIGSWKWAVVGIGMNINQTSFPGNLANPVSLKQITGKDFNTITLAKELCICLEYRFQQLKAAESKKLSAAYNKQLYKVHETVRLKKENAAFLCQIEGVKKNGQLMVSGASQDSFSFGEVEWVL